MAERVFAGKLQRAGFTDVWVGGHQPFGIDQAALYPLFTPEVIQVMKETIPADHQDHVATGVIVKARKPGWRWQINGQRQYDSDPAHAGEIEVRFGADGPDQTTVGPRPLERRRQASRSALSSLL